MSNNPEFGLLEDVSLREAWAHEAHAFTPWLADNLDRLGDAIGVRLELVGCEVNVGRYNADILARSVLDDKVVLIENQLERSDHGHLGQIMTYLAGTEAKIIVWVAREFCEEHLSAIRWLNEHSHEDFSFFAVRLRVVRIGASPLAPLLEVLEKPNDWDRSIQHEVRTKQEDSDRVRIRRAFWDRYAQLYPAMAVEKARGGNTSRWCEVPGRPVCISRYKAAKEVGIFLRGLNGQDEIARAALVEPYADQLVQRLDVPAGRTFGFAKVGPKVTEDPASWDPAIHWLEQETRRYKEAVEAVFPEEAA